MLKFVLALTTFACALLLSLPTLADGHTHTPNVCSTQNVDLCAHLGLHEAPTSKAPGRFIVDIMIPDQSAVTNLTVTLWMPDMGHGSAPVKIQDIGNNHFLVTDAYFLMAGTWVVKLSFENAGVSHQIDIPLEIAE